METILAVNAGSSSVKFQVFVPERDGPRRLIKGQVSGVAVQPKLRAQDEHGKLLVDQSYACDLVKDIPAALQMAAAWLRDAQKLEPIAVGHRVVHGGPIYDRPVLLDAAVLDHLERYVSLAPLHQPNNLAPIRALLARSPDLPQAACFDTAFHRGHDANADRYAIPERFYAEGVRRYGFHGLSYEYIAERLQQVAPEVAKGKVIVAHLGSGASMCALSRGRSVESTMGFTALDGLPMGTRPGQMDPGIVLYLIDEKKMSSAEVQSLLYHECGLKGLSGISNDVRDLEQSPAAAAQSALDYFAYRVGLYAGQLAAALGGLDAFVFTAGIGENSPTMRARITKKLGWLGATLDYEANRASKLAISDTSSRIGLYVIPTDEEMMIARHTQMLLTKRPTARTDWRPGSAAGALTHPGCACPC